MSPELGATWFIPGCNDILRDRRELPESTVTTAGIARWYRFDLKALVQQWLDGTTPNNGALLRCESCVGGVKPSPPDLEPSAAVPLSESVEEEQAVAQFPSGRPTGPLPGQLCPYSFLFASSENSDSNKWPRLVVRYQ